MSLRKTPGLLGQFSRTASYLLGSLAILSASAVALTSGSPGDLSRWVLEVLGLGFVGLLSGLVFTAAFSYLRMQSAEGAEERHFWLACGLQAANGVTTLALTFTLLGISLGIGSLAGRDLNPETVQSVIRELTANFSLAFMTTVVGLPVAAVLRAGLLIRHQRLDLEDSRRIEILAPAEPTKATV
ncbi:MAG: hypothetical protein ACPGOV_06605 [Magnetovibrionaceae bacterium]